MREGFESNPMSWGDYWAIAVRRRWWLMGSLFACGFLALGLAYVWPERYQSEALILIEQLKIPELYATPNVATDLQDRLQNMTQQILSRTRLQKLIEQFNLYPQYRHRKTIDHAVDAMRDDIGIQLVKAPRRPGELTAFRISYLSENPRVAQQITDELTALFIQENLEARDQQSLSTTTFLEAQVEQSRKELAEQEQRLREYKLRHLGELPEQQQSLLQMLGGLEVELHSTTAAIDRAEQQRVYLEFLRTEYERIQQSRGAVNAAEVTAQDLRKQLIDLEAKYTSHHPDVEKARKQLNEWEELRKRPSIINTQPGEANLIQSPPEPALAEIDSRLKATRVEIDTQRREAAELRRRMAGLQSRLNSAPMREQQLAEVTRNYEISRQNYQSLLQKKLQSELAMNLERRHQGEQFRVIDPPNLPLRASAPKRLRIVLIGWGLGFCLGLCLTAFQEMRDDSIHNERTLLASFRLPVVIQIPVLRSRGEQKYMIFSRALETMAAALLFFLSIVAGIYTYKAG